MKLITKTLMAASGVVAIGAAVWMVATRKNKTSQPHIEPIKQEKDSKPSDDLDQPQ